MRSTTLEGQVTTRDAAGALPEDLNASVNFSLTESMGSLNRNSKESIVDPIEEKQGVEARRDCLKMTAVIPLAVSLGGFRSGKASAQEGDRILGQ